MIRTYRKMASVVAVGAMSVVIGLLFWKPGNTHEHNVAGEKSPVVRPSPSPGYRPPSERGAKFLNAATNRLERESVPWPFALFLSPSATNYSGGMTALRDLPEVLSDGQIETLRDMLAVPYDPRMPGTLIEFNGLKNAAAEFLIQQPAFPSDLLFDFAAMFEDVAYDAVWRDYCLQMLGQGYLGLSGRGGQDASDARSLAVAVLLEATGAHSGTWAGTALLGLYAVMSSDPEAVPAGVFTNEVVKAASDTSASEAVRITALRLAGACRMAEVHSSALRLAGAAGTETLRAAAIATLGEVGKVEDRELLTGFAMEDDPVVSTAAKRACQLLPGKIE